MTKLRLREGWNCALILALMIGLPLLALAFDQAPTGTYTATTGAGGATGGGTGAGGHTGHAGGGSSSTGSKSVSILISSYSTQAEMDALKAAQGDPKKFFDTLATYNHGSVTIAGKSYPVNAAYSVGNGANFSISLASAKPYSTSGSSHMAKGASGGYVHLTVDSTGAGTGVMATSTQIVISSTSGEFEAKVGGSAAVQLTGVKRQ